MFVPENKQVLVMGLSTSGVAACELLRARGAKVLAVDNADTSLLRQQAERLRALGVEVRIGQKGAPDTRFDLAVLSPDVRMTDSIVQELARREVPVIGELELGWQQTYCPTIGITGTKGKTTTAELVERLLAHNGLKTLTAGDRRRPVCAVAGRTKELDWLTLEVSSFQLETIEHFRPGVAVLMNLTPDHLDRYASASHCARATGRIFMNQQPFDYAIVQSEALAQLQSLGVTIPSKIITFSANNRRADLCLERGLLLSRLPDWSGPLLDMDHCQVRGPHNAENLMAALAVGRVLRVPLESMVEALRSYPPPPHRCELVAEIGGVKFVNDSQATNLDAVAKALQTMPAGPAPGEPNVWLLAGGRDKGLEYYDIGPLLSQRVKGAFVFGETREKIRAAWSLFTACAPVGTLLEAISEAAKKAVSGDVVLLSPACSSFDQFQDDPHRGEVFRQAVRELEKIGQEGKADSAVAGSGANAPTPEAISEMTEFAAGFVEGEPRRGTTEQHLKKDAARAIPK